MNLEEFLRRCLELGAEGVEVDELIQRTVKDPVEVLKSFRNKFKYLNWSETQNYTSRGKEAREAIAKAKENIAKAKETGATIMRIVSGGNRFLKDPSKEEQIKCIKRNLEPVVSAAEDLKLALALENHADFRAEEIVDIIKSFNSLSLRATFDTGNALPVGEDFYDAAEILAPYTINVHLKDWKVTPLTYYGAKLVGTPLGKGVVDLPRIIEILRKAAPNVERLPVNIEVMLEEGDEDEAVEESISYTRKLPIY